MIKLSGKDAARVLVKPTKRVALPRHVHFVEFLYNFMVHKRTFLVIIVLCLFFDNLSEQP